MGSELSSEQLKPAAVRKRTGSRLAAFQFTYSRSLSDNTFSDALDGFRSQYLEPIMKQLKISKIDEEHFTTLIATVKDKEVELDGLIESRLKKGWSMGRLASHELILLRLGCLELMDLPHIPAKAVLSEYSAMADEFVADTSFINAVLDNLARQFRKVEMGEI